VQQHQKNLTKKESKMAQSDKDNSNKPKWQQRLEAAATVVGGLAAFVAAVNGVDLYVHHHPNGLNNHNDKG